MDHSPSASIGVQKVTHRLIPFVGICYLIAYIDRQNVRFAKLQMVGDLDLSEYAYRLSASLFIIGYFSFEVPSNAVMEEVGARRFVRIMISWGLVTVALAYTQNVAMFCILRFLLGACETGFLSDETILLQFEVEKVLAVYESRDGRLVDTKERLRLEAGPVSIRSMPR
jgi:hypothetical protein